MIKVLQMPAFRQAYKRLHNNQKLVVDQAIRTLIKDPTCGERKKGDLQDVYVYKFNCLNQQYLLAYEYDTTHRLLLALGMHENFYRNLKRKK